MSAGFGRRQQCGERGIRAAGGRILRHAIRWGEHPGSAIHPIGPFGVQMKVWKSGRRNQSRHGLGGYTRPRQGLRGDQLGHQKRQPHRRAARGVAVDRDRRCVKADRRGDQRRIDGFAECQRRGCNQLGLHMPIGAPGHRDRHDPGPLLEAHGRGAIQRAKFPEQGQGGGRADVRMAGERHLAAGSENAHATVAASFWRQHEGRFGEIELPGNALHLRAVQSTGIRDHGERIAPEALVGEDIEDQEPGSHRVLFVSGSTSIHHCPRTGSR